MGMFDNSEFRAPTMPQTAVPSIQDFLSYRNAQQQRQADMEKDFMNFQSNLRMNELAKTMSLEKANQPKPQQNVVYNPLITPFEEGRLRNEADRNRITEQNNLNRNTVAEERNDIASRGVDIKADAANDPNLVQMKTAGGDVYYIDKKSGRVVNTGVSQGTLTGTQQFQNKQTLQGEAEAARAALEGTKQGNRVQLVNIRGNQATSNIKTRGEEDRKTKSTASPNANKDLPTQQVVAQKLRAQQFMNSNPELAKFVNIDPNTGLVNVTQPSTGSSLFSFGSKGPSQDDYHKILDALYGERSSVSDRPDHATTTVTAPVSTDIFVVKDGKKFKLNNPSQLEAALKQGYQQVK